MRWGSVPAIVVALACAAPAAAQDEPRVSCGPTVAPWRLSVPQPLTAKTCLTVIGLHGGSYRTEVRRAGQLALVIETAQWQPPWARRTHADTPLPIQPRTQVVWRDGFPYRVRVLQLSAAVRAAIRSFRFAR